MTYWYPPLYYNHFVEHPILWSEDKRRWEERKLANECYQVWQTQKRIAASDRLRSQSEYREMVTNWNPFGKQGGGAPNNDIRIRNLEMDGLFPIPRNSTRNALTLPRTNASQARVKYYNPGMGGVSGGSGAPIISETGKQLTLLHEDPVITFGDSTRNYVDKDLRYRKTTSQKNAYKQELDKIIEEKKRLKFNEKFSGGAAVHFRNQNDAFADSWGKPGPGGTPWRDPKNVGQNFMKSMGWTTKDTLKSINNDMQQQSRCKPQATSCCERCSCECVKKIESTILRSPPQKQQQQQMSRDEPIRKSPKKSPPHYALPQHCNRQEREKLEPIQPQPSSKIAKQQIKKSSKTNLISGNVELVPLLASKRDERPISLSTTDITKYKINKSSGQDGNPEYLNDLERQVIQRNRLRQLSREREIESSRQHFANFDSFWGRPGCGAPQNNKNKLNLDNLLYNPPCFEINQTTSQQQQLNCQHC